MTDKLQEATRRLVAEMQIAFTQGDYAMADKLDDIVNLLEDAAVAQSAEQLHCRQTVPGSIPGGGFDYWDVGEEFNTRPPNFGLTCSAKIFKALVTCDGQLLCSFVAGMKDDPDHLRCVLYRIKLPAGTKEMFEELSGYILTKTPTIRGL